MGERCYKWTDSFGSRGGMSEVWREVRPRPECVEEYKETRFDLGNRRNYGVGLGSGSKT
jgi:hypothetical protein